MSLVDTAARTPDATPDPADVAAGAPASAGDAVVRGRVQALPLAASSVRLAVSRGSLPFWDDIPAAFAEIHRVLCPGGAAFIGGGLGDPARRAELEAACRSRHPHWNTGQRRPPTRPDQEYAAALHRAGIDPFEVQRGDDGLWIVFVKEAGCTRL